MAKNQETISRNTEASIKNLEMQIEQLSRQIAGQPSSSEGFLGNTVDNTKNENSKTIELRN